MKRELIDRAAALAGIAAWDWQELYLPAHFKQVIEDCPTIEERPHGRWIRHAEQKNIYGGKCIECSECGEKYIVQYIEDEKFCRNGGAKMDAEGMKR